MGCGQSTAINSNRCINQDDCTPNPITRKSIKRLSISHQNANIRQLENQKANQLSTKKDIGSQAVRSKSHTSKIKSVLSEQKAAHSRTKFVFSDDSSLPKIVVKYSSNKSESPAQHRICNQVSSTSSRPFAQPPNTSHSPVKQKDLIRASKSLLPVNAKKSRLVSRDVLPVAAGICKEDRISSHLGFIRMTSNLDGDSHSSFMPARNLQSSRSNRFTAEWPDKSYDQMHESACLMSPSSKRRNAPNNSAALRQSGGYQMSVTFHRYDESRLSANDSEIIYNDRVPHSNVAHTFGDRSDRHHRQNADASSIDCSRNANGQGHPLAMPLESNESKISISYQKNSKGLKRHNSAQAIDLDGTPFDCADITGSHHIKKYPTTDIEGLHTLDDGHASHALDSSYRVPVDAVKRRKLLRLPSDLLGKMSKKPRIMKASIVNKNEQNGSTTMISGNQLQSLANLGNNIVPGDQNKVPVKSAIALGKQQYLLPQANGQILNLIDVARRKQSFNAKENIFKKVNSSTVSITLSRKSSEIHL